MALSRTFLNFSGDGTNAYSVEPPASNVSSLTLLDVELTSGRRIQLVLYPNGELWEVDEKGNHVRQLRNSTSLPPATTRGEL